MKNLLPIAITVITLLFNIGLADVGMAKESEAVNMLSAKHILMPLVGYQNMDGEQTGYNFSITIPPGPPFFQEITFDDEKRIEIDQKSSVVGAVYRYLFHPNMHADFSLGMILNKETTTYPVTFRILNFTSRFQLTASRSNTMFSGADFVGKVPYSLKLLGSRLTTSGRVGGGMSWRSYKVNNSIPPQQLDGLDVDIELVDAEQLAYFRGGIDFSVWSTELLLLNVSVLYTQYMPIDSDSDPFGGIGWQFSLFPMWR